MGLEKSNLADCTLFPENACVGLTTHITLNGEIPEIIICYAPCAMKLDLSAYDGAGGFVEKGHIRALDRAQLEGAGNFVSLENDFLASFRGKGVGVVYLDDPMSIAWERHLNDLLLCDDQTFLADEMSNVEYALAQLVRSLWGILVYQNRLRWRQGKSHAYLVLPRQFHVRQDQARQTRSEGEET